MSVKAEAEKLLARSFTCHKCGSRDFAERKTALLRCARCETVCFEAGVHFNHVLKNEDMPPEIKRYLRRLLAKDWPKCEKCKRRFKAIDKHVARKHDSVLFPKEIPELF